MSREILAQQVGRSVFGRDPAAYQRGRPGHPERVYEVLRERCGLTAGTRALEIGPGTGQATRRLLELGADPLVAVEPDASLAVYLPSVTDGKPEILPTTLEDAELPEGSFDLAVAASSFHWIDADRGLAAVRDALREGGWWAMWWSHFGDKTRADSFRDAIDHLFVDLPSSPHCSRRSHRSASSVSFGEERSWTRSSGSRLRISAIGSSSRSSRPCTRPGARNQTDKRRTLRA